MHELGVPDEEAMVHVAVFDLSQRMPTLPERQIESTVRRWVGWWTHHARVEKFVGIIATRSARSELEVKEDAVAGRVRPRVTLGSS